jgi:hypothetical protein
MRDSIAAIQLTMGTVGDSKIILRYDDEAGRDFLVPSPTAGMMAWTDTPAALWIYKGSAWQRVDDAGHGIQNIVNVETTSSNVSIDGGIDTIISSTVTLPETWNSMRVMLLGQITFYPAAGGGTLWVAVNINGDQRQYSWANGQSIANVPITAVSVVDATGDIPITVTGELQAGDPVNAAYRNLVAHKTRTS